MRILLTGCAGFIGFRVSSLLLNLGHQVYGTDSLGKSQYARLRKWRLNSLLEVPGFEFRQADISDPAELRAIFEGGDPRRPVTAVVNLAALAGVRGSIDDPRRYYEVNVLGTLNLLEACREFAVGKFILASSSSVYGAEIDGPVSEDADSGRPLSPYAASKKASETLLYSYHHLQGMEAVALRYFTVYGPAGRPDMSIFRFIRAIAEDEPITVYGDGTQQRDFTYVDDIARGTIAALNLTGYETINLGCGAPAALNDVISLIEEAVGKVARVQYRERHPADPLMTWADIGLARDILGWTPTVGIEEGIRCTVKWYLANREWASLLR